MDVVAFVRELTIARRLLKLGAWRLDEIKHRLIKAGLTRNVAAGHNYTSAAMPLALMIESELHFSADLKRPFREKTDTFRRPLDVLFDEVDRVGVADRNSHAIISPCLVLDRHTSHHLGYLLLNTD